MKRKIFGILAFATAAAFGEYFGDCAPVTGVKNTTTGETKNTEPMFLKSACPTQEDLTQGILRYLQATNQQRRDYVVIEKEHWYLLHFTDE